MQRSLRLLNDHLVASSHENGDRIRVLAVLQDEDAVLLSRIARSERHLLDLARGPELVRRQFLHSCHDAPASRNGHVLDLHASDPTNGRQVLLQQQVVGFVVESPLADDEVGAAVLDLFDHVAEVLLLLAVQLFVRLDRRDFQLVLRLWLWRLERARQDAHLGIVDDRWHLRVREFLVENDPAHELRVLQRSTGLAFKADHVEVDIVMLQVGDLHHGVDGNLSHPLLVRLQDFAVQCRSGGLQQRLQIVLREFDAIGDLSQMVNCHLRRSFESTRNAHRMDSLLQQPFRLLEQGAGQHHNPSRSVPDLVILRRAELDHQLCNLVMYLHLSHDGRAIVGDRHVAVRTHQQLVHSLRTQRRAENVGDRSGRQNVRFGGVQSLDARLCLLLLQDDEGPSVFIVYHRHLEGVYLYMSVYLSVCVLV
mmetsp:Transcript_22985/g.65132  ORF Transcript_22985/g.65132 Transcript_22985/m.65132 type:complete len:422 (+) Transcript_22985:575-1840(+)